MTAAWSLILLSLAASGAAQTAAVALGRPEPATASCSALGAPGFSRLFAPELRPPREFAACLNGAGFVAPDFVYDGSTNTFLRSTIAVRLQVLDRLGAFAQIGLSRNESSIATPTVLTSRGDLWVGVSTAHALDGLRLGAVLALDFPSGVEGETARGPTAGGLLAAQASAPLPTPPRFPAAVLANVYFRLDNSANLVSPAGVSDLPAFALGIEQFHKLGARIGAQVAVGRLQGFLVWDLAYPLGSGSALSEAPHRLVPGVRFAPLPELAIDLALEIGLSGTPVAGVAPTPPYLATLALAWTPDLSRAMRPTGRLAKGRVSGAVRDDQGNPVSAQVSFPEHGERVESDPETGNWLSPELPAGRTLVRVEGGGQRRETVVEVNAGETVATPEIRVGAAPAKTGRLAGVVADESGRAVAADVSFPEHAVPVVRSDAKSGAWTSPELPAGPTLVRIEAEGRREEQRHEVRAGQTATVPQVQLAAAPAALGATDFPLLKVRVIGREKEEEFDKLAIWAVLTVVGPSAPNGRQYEVPGELEVRLMAGEYYVEAEAQGFLVRGRRITLPPRQEVPIEFELRRAPKIAVAELTREEIVIKETIRFAFSQARIEPVSFGVLDNVASILLKNAGIQVRIEGHTDPLGTPEVNLKLSQDRAEAVSRYLVEAGVAAERLEARGYGATRPVADNATEAGRAKNRRVQFVVVRAGGGPS